MRSYCFWGCLTCALTSHKAGLSSLGLTCQMQEADLMFMPGDSDWGWGSLELSHPR